MKVRNYIVPIAVTVAVAWTAFCGYQWCWGPFHCLHDLKTRKLPGNAVRYAPENTEMIENSPLSGKQLIFLGSSVTYGASAKGVSFVDYIAARNRCNIIKEAVSGTTLVDNGTDSYIARLKRIKEKQADLFICQLSTNDSSQKKPLGSIAETFRRDSFDTGTVVGAIEFIISYARETWECPVVFYTNPKYNSETYSAMVDLLREIAVKWDILVIDMWNDETFNELTSEQRQLYMADAIHPTQAGYLEWWTPYMERVMVEILSKSKI